MDRRVIQLRCQPQLHVANRTVVSFAEDRPELLQGTVIDITEHKKAQARLRGIKGAEAAARMAEGEGARMADLSQRLATLLRRVSKTLQPNNLPKTDRAEIQECVLALEQMKMLVSELELLHLFPE